MALNLQKLGTSAPVTQATEMRGDDATSDIKIGKMINNAHIRQMVNKQNLVYVSKLSPFCRFIKTACLSYFAILVITLVLLISNNKACGLDADNHILRMRNTTSPISCDGLFLVKANSQTFNTYDPGLVDTVRKVDLNNPATMITDMSDTSTLSLMDSSTTIRAQQFPLAMVFNYTKSENKAYIKELVFEAKTDSSIEDNGAAFDVVISNPRRAPIRTNESWFNLDVWVDKKGQHFKYIPGGSGPAAPDRCGSKFLLNDSLTNYWTIPPITSPLSFMPVWYADLASLMEKTESCTSPYKMSVKLQPWYCFSPLLIRQLPYQDVTFKNVSFYGELILDFDESSTTKNVTLKFATASVDRIYLTKAPVAPQVFFIDSRLSNISLYIADPPIVATDQILDFYGLSGNVTTTETAEDLYQVKYQVRKTLSNDIVFNISTYDRAVVVDAVANTVKIGADSIVKFEFDGNKWYLEQDLVAQNIVTIKKK